MNRSTFTVIIYIIVLILLTAIFDLWGSETGLKALIGFTWTIIFLIALFYVDKNDKK